METSNGEDVSSRDILEVEDGVARRTERRVGVASLSPPSMYSTRPRLSSSESLVSTRTWAVEWVTVGL